jgi:hypothetical protein
LGDLVSALGRSGDHTQELVFRGGGEQRGMEGAAAETVTDQSNANGGVQGISSAVCRLPSAVCRLPSSVFISGLP